jgi:NifU-like protein involved in Fe-S cluster formation
MSENNLQERIAEAIRNPKNMGELEAADAVGTVGNSQCGEMLRMWIKFKEDNGKRVIDRATFQSFGCETAIAVASLATEMIRGKTAEEALSLSGADLSGELGPLPPMKIHCSQLVEGALRSALAPACASAQPVGSSSSPGQIANSNLLDNFTKSTQQAGTIRVVLLDQKQGG